MPSPGLSVSVSVPTPVNTALRAPPAALLLPLPLMLLSSMTATGACAASAVDSASRSTCAPVCRGAWRVVCVSASRRPVSTEGVACRPRLVAHILPRPELRGAGIVVAVAERRRRAESVPPPVEAEREEGARPAHLAGDDLRFRGLRRRRCVHARTQRLLVDDQLLKSRRLVRFALGGFLLRQPLRELLGALARRLLGAAVRLAVAAAAAAAQEPLQLGGLRPFVQAEVEVLAILAAGVRHQQDLGPRVRTGASAASGSSRHLQVALDVVEQRVEPELDGLLDGLQPVEQLVGKAVQPYFSFCLLLTYTGLMPAAAAAMAPPPLGSARARGAADVGVSELASRW